MRLITAKIRGFGPFTDYTLDLESLGDAQIVSVCGPNGAGKTTSLELALPGAAYRDCPTRGALRDLATGRDSSLEVRLAHAGREYTIRHIVDKVSGKSESLVMSDGVPVLETTKVKDFDEWSARTFLPSEVLLASTFGSQASAGFLGAKPTERKAILLRALGLEAWESRAERAAARAKEVESALQLTRAKLAVLPADNPDAERACELQTDAVRELEESLEKHRAELAALDQQLAAQTEAERTRQAMLRERERVTQDGDAATREVDTLIAKRDEVTEMLARAASIRAAVDEVASARAEMDRLSVDEASKSAELRAVERELSGILIDDVEALKRAATDLEQRLLAARERVVELESQVDAATDEDMTAAQDASDAIAAHDEAIDRQLNVKQRRIDVLRGGLEGIANGSVIGYQDHAVAVLGADDAIVAAADNVIVDALRERAQKAHTAADECGRRLQKLQRELDSAQSRERELASQMETKRSELARAESEGARLLERHNELTATSVTLKTELASMQQARTAAMARVSEHTRLATMAPALEHAERSSVEITERLTAAKERRAQCQARLAEVDSVTLPVIDPLPTPRRKDQATLVSNTETRLSRERDALAKARHALEVVVTARAQRAELTALVTSQEQELADWTRLKDDLGKNGIQAAEIDGALGELNTLVNDLLHECHSSRWTMRIDTQRLAGDGKRMIETLDVFILDTENSREGKAETFSGGERAILGEALALALTMVSCRRAGLERPTLVRDESGAALDPSNARAYVAMLRRAAKYVDASHVLFVSHSPELTELADAQIAL